MRPTRGCSTGRRGLARGTPPLSEQPVRVAAAADPVAAFLDAHEHRQPVALETSGSADRPRAVVRSTGSWVDSFAEVSALTGIGAGSRVWVPGPLRATMNLFAAVHARAVGATLQPTADGATHAHLTPAALSELLQRTQRRDGLTVVVGGDRLSPGLARQATRAGMRVCHYYGAAELSFVAWGGDAGDLRPFPGARVECRDGEVWVASPYLCDGYDGPPGPLRSDSSGYATVGDRGRLDGDRLVVVGRAGAVTTAGATVHLADVEQVLREDARGDVVLLGVPHDRLGSLLAVVLTDARDHATLRARSRGRLTGAARPRLWFHVPDLPRTDAGKVDRAALTALLATPDAVRRLT
jgi:long-chain acyl-CoA synthetase